MKFTIRKQTCQTVQMDNVDLPQKNEVKYLGKAHQNQKKSA
jgi:hypothetical protein